MAKKRKTAGDGAAGTRAGSGGEPPQLAVMKNGKPVVAGPGSTAAPAMVQEKMSPPAPKRKKTSKKPASTLADSESGMDG